MEIIVYNDACEERVGSMIMREGRVMAYEYKKLKEHE